MPRSAARPLPGSSDGRDSDGSDVVDVAATCHDVVDGWGKPGDEGKGLLA